jgi:hypothetical protein
MYRSAPDHALYQGDILVVPMTGLRESDPPLITDVPYPQPCPSCHTPMEAPTCPACGVAPKNLKRFTAASTRIKKNDNPFVNDAAVRVPANMESVAAMLLSNTCDIDQKDYVRFCPVRSMASPKGLSDRQKSALREGSDTAPIGYLYLPPTGRMPEAVAFLGYAFTLKVVSLGRKVPFFSRNAGRNDNALVPFVEAVESRLTSLSEDGLRALYHESVRSDTHQRVEMKFPPAMLTAALEDDPDRPQAGARTKQGWWWPPPSWLVAPSPPIAAPSVTT